MFGQGAGALSGLLILIFLVISILAPIWLFLIYRNSAKTVIELQKLNKTLTGQKKNTEHTKKTISDVDLAINSKKTMLLRKEHKGKTC